jgi:predicted GIY-YIG superfamily endonuclease
LTHSQKAPVTRRFFQVESMYYVYILQCGDGSLYTGITVDVARRLRLHQSGKGAKYTRSHLPVSLVYQEPQPDKSSALRREIAIKKLTRAQKLRLIEDAGNPLFHNL